jgi:hypothetical protein
MVSLSTVYSVSIVLASLSAMGAAMVGTKVYPIQSGGDPLAAGIGVGATITGLFAAAANKIKGTFSSESAPEPVPEPTPEALPPPTPDQLPPPTPDQLPPETTEEERLKQTSLGSSV